MGFPAGGRHRAKGSNGIAARPGGLGGTPVGKPDLFLRIASEKVGKAVRLLAGKSRKSQTIQSKAWCRRIVNIYRKSPRRFADAAGLKR